MARWNLASGKSQSGGGDHPIKLYQARGLPVTGQDSTMRIPEPAQLTRKSKTVGRAAGVTHCFFNGFSVKLGGLRGLGISI